MKFFKHKIKIRIKRFKFHKLSLAECIIWYYAFIILFNNIIAQIQMAFLKNLVIDTSVLASATIPVIYFLLFNSFFGKNRVSKSYNLMFFGFIYTLFIIIYYIINSADIFLLFNFIYKKILPLLFVITLLFLKSKINFEFFEKQFGLFAFINAAVTVIQFITDDILWPYITDNHGDPLFWSVYNYGNFDRIRPPGLMSSALSSGYISIIWICLMLYRLLNKAEIKRINKCKYAFFIVLAFCSILATQTRNIYITLFFILVYCIIANISKNRIYIMPIFTILATVIYFLLFMYVLPAINTTTGLLNNGSSIIRYRNWLYLINKISRENVFEKLFGIMKWQEVAPNEVFSDNLFFDVFFAMGLIGLVIYILINLRLQTLLLKSKNCISISALVSSILFMGVPNVPNSSYESVILIFSAIIISNFRYISTANIPKNKSKKMRYIVL